MGFLAELTTHIAQPYEKLTNYHGYYSNRSRGKRKKEQKTSQPAESTSETQSEKAPPASRKSWARLIKKVYEVDPLVCPKCSAPLKLIAVIEDPDVIYRILKHCHLLDPEQEPRPPPTELSSIPSES